MRSRSMDTIGWPAATVCRTSVGTVIARHIYINYVSFPRLGLLCKWPFCRVGCQRSRLRTSAPSSAQTVSRRRSTRVSPCRILFTYESAIGDNSRTRDRKCAGAIFGISSWSRFSLAIPTPTATDSWLSGSG